MTLDLKRIFANDGERLDIAYMLDMTDFELSGNYPLNKPVKIDGFVENRASVVSINLSVMYEFSAPCDRCGIDTVHKHSVEISKLLATSLERQESDTIIEVPDMKLDVDELVYTEVVLSLPTKHLCKDSCKGICQKCGKDLNEGDCGCSEKEIDPRLSALADLLKN